MKEKINFSMTLHEEDRIFSTTDLTEEQLHQLEKRLETQYGGRVSLIPVRMVMYTPCVTKDGKPSRRLLSLKERVQSFVNRLFH